MALKTNRNLNILIGIIVLSLLGNIFLWSQLKNYKNSSDYLLGRNYTAFFNALEVYNNRLDYIINNVGSHTAIQREILSLQEDVTTLVYYAQSYGLGKHTTKSLLPATIWEIAMSSQWILREHFLQANEIDIVDELDSIQVAKIREYSALIREIIQLENSTRDKMAISITQINQKGMADALYPKAMKASDLTTRSDISLQYIY